VPCSTRSRWVNQSRRRPSVVVQLFLPSGASNGCRLLEPYGREGVHMAHEVSRSIILVAHFYRDLHGLTHELRWHFRLFISRLAFCRGAETYVLFAIFVADYQGEIIPALITSDDPTKCSDFCRLSKRRSIQAQSIRAKTRAFSNIQTSPWKRGNWCLPSLP
jgi:hypothetical protein